MTEVEKTKSLIRSVLMATPEGIPINKFSQEYSAVTLERLPLLGYKNVHELCSALSDVIRIDTRGNYKVLFAVSHESTKHVEALIANQKKKKVSHSGSNGRSTGHHTHTNVFHKSILSRNSRYNPAPISFSRQPRRTNYNHNSPPTRYTADDKPKRTESKQGRSVWEKLGEPVNPYTPRVHTPANRASPPERVVSIASDDSLLTSLTPSATSDEWVVPSNSPTWRYEYSQARSYPIRELPSYARPGDLIYVIGYFFGPRQVQVQHRILKSGRVQEFSVVSFHINESTFLASSSLACNFKYPHWSLPTYKAPNQIKEDTWLKVYGSYDDGEISACYLEVFTGTFKANDLASVMNDMSSLSVGNTSVSPPEDSNREVRLVSSPLSSHSTSPSDTSVYTDSGSCATEDDEAGDQGYFSPGPSPGRIDFPLSNMLSAFNVPKEFTSRVKSISSITHFYLVMDENDGTLDNLTNTLTTRQQTAKLGNLLIPGQCKDLLCSAFNVTTSKWHRARFLNNYPNGSSTYAVSFIDLGEETQIPVCYIRPFLPEFLQLSAQALPCALPLPQEMASDQQLIALFRKLVSNVPLKTRVKKISEDKFQVDLATPEDKNIVSEIMSAFTDRKHSNPNFSNYVTRPNHFTLNLPVSCDDLSPPLMESSRDVLLTPPTPSPSSTVQTPTPQANSYNNHFFPNSNHIIPPKQNPIPPNGFLTDAISAPIYKPPIQRTTYFNIPSPKAALPTAFISPPGLTTVTFPMRMPSQYIVTMPQ